MITAVAPPFEAVRRMAGRSAAEVYRFIYDHSSMEQINRIYNTSNWSVKGISGETGMHRDTVSRAIDKLLDNGFIGIAGTHKSSSGSDVIVWAVYSPDWIPNVRHSIELMGQPSKRLKAIRTKMKKVQPSEDLYSWDF
nr:hypothetical protein 17 [bacterium]